MDYSFCGNETNVIYIRS